MDRNAIVKCLDEEIERLEQAKALLRQTQLPTSTPKFRVIPGGRERRRHTVSPEGRARIAAAQRKRWAKQKALAKKAA